MNKNFPAGVGDAYIYSVDNKRTTGNPDSVNVENGSKVAVYVKVAPNYSLDFTKFTASNLTQRVERVGDEDYNVYLIEFDNITQFTGIAIYIGRSPVVPSLEANNSKYGTVEARNANSQLYIGDKSPWLRRQTPATDSAIGRLPPIRAPKPSKTPPTFTPSPARTTDWWQCSCPPNRRRQPTPFRSERARVSRRSEEKKNSIITATPSASTPKPKPAMNSKAGTTWPPARKSAETLTTTSPSLPTSFWRQGQLKKPSKSTSKRLRAAKLPARR